MIQAFLSHSSKDKMRYVSIVADRLGPALAVYDEYTFEAGMQPLEEIVRGLDTSQIMVVFLSEFALESDWVKEELLLGQRKLVSHELERIFPIIIDPALLYSDPRIPQWMRDNYNLKYVARPTVAVRRIRQRLREVSWLHNPRLEERGRIFVGRNDLVSLVETRVDDVDQEFPTCFIASGVPRIGRSSLLRHSLIKCNAVRQSYEFPEIVLRRQETLEDLLLKLYDLGFSSMEYPKNLMTLDAHERVAITSRVVKDIQSAKETILIHDEGCIVNYASEIQPWFDDVLCQVHTNQSTTFLVASRYRPRPDRIRSKPYIYALEVQELSYVERRGLFRRLVEFEGLALDRDDYAFFTGLFQGFPDQILFACERLRDFGVSCSRKDSYLITEFNSDKAATLVGQYVEQPATLDFLYLLSEFEFISLDFLFTIAPEDEYGDLLKTFLNGCICDYVGIEKEFVRLNDVVRDYVRRNRLDIPPVFRKRLAEHLEQFIRSDDEEERDVSDTIYSIKECIKTGRSVPEQYIVSSHVLRSIRELYEQRGHLNRVIELCDKLLEKGHLLDATLAQDVRYYLCLSLARQGDTRLLAEVQKINGPEHSFLLGFYYRLQRRPDDAISRLEECLNLPVVATRAKRELVQVYLSIEDYDSASTLAESNYESNRRNAFHVQAYFNTLVNSRDPVRQRDTLVRLIKELRIIDSDMANQMADIAEAEMLSKCDDNYRKAADKIQDAVHKYPDSHYPLLVKGYLAVKHRDRERLSEACDALVVMAKKRTVSDMSLVRLRAYLLALDGDIDRAVSLAKDGLRKCPEYSVSAFVERLRNILE